MAADEGVTAVLEQPDASGDEGEEDPPAEPSSPPTAQDDGAAEDDDPASPIDAPSEEEAGGRDLPQLPPLECEEAVPVTGPYPRLTPQQYDNTRLPSMKR